MSIPPSSILPPPFINIPLLPNLRPLPALPTSTSTSTTRPNILFRSADPSKTSLADIARLHDEFGIRRIFDLRSTPEIERGGELEAWEGRLAEFRASRGEGEEEGGEERGIERVWCPVFAEEDYSPEKVAVRFKDYAREGTEGFAEAYTSILRAAGPCFRKIFLHLSTLAPTLQNPARACLIHCTAGKDRTGVFCAILLTLLEVPAQTIADEYALTEVGLGHMKQHFIDRIMQSEAFSGPGGAGREGAERMVTSRAENMLATLKRVESDFGGAESYVREVCGLSDEDVIRLKRVFLVQDGSVSDESRGHVQPVL
ncbi:hypothetical protein K402DRAFT_351361 [Aulographum hederae CBS 113979]|uniref:Tyrosine specific protein phosphatases domain-containing protein n=1 Tax=Aulographum hederae CBS 113979 TaxID=1176131 RepID=A0A6G1H6L5_9PEZI|nr:hypothetical protein K402DRAFT_351361 [Aulographum hederae CBS 113979]